MTFYELRIRTEDAAPSGYDSWYFTSRRAAERKLAELRRECAADDRILLQPDEARIEKLDFHGTARQMVLAALTYAGNR